MAYGFSVKSPASLQEQFLPFFLFFSPHTNASEGIEENHSYLWA